MRDCKLIVTVRDDKVNFEDRTSVLRSWHR